MPGVLPVDSPAALALRDAGIDHSRRAVFARDVARGGAGARHLLGACRARRGRRLRSIPSSPPSRAARQVYFDTATMVLMLFTRRRAISRPRAGPGRRATLSRCWPPKARPRRWSMSGVEIAPAACGRSKPGMLVRVRPGERIPVDGVVVEGRSHADEAVITGESRQIAKGAGCAVIAGSMNLDGPLLCVAAAPARRPAGRRSAVRSARPCRAAAPSSASPIGSSASRCRSFSLLGGLAVAYWARRFRSTMRSSIGLAVLVVACPARSVSPRRWRPRSGSAGSRDAAASCGIPALWRRLRARGSSPSTRPVR